MTTFEAEREAARKALVDAEAVARKSATAACHAIFYATPEAQEKCPEIKIQAVLAYNQAALDAADHEEKLKRYNKLCHENPQAPQAGLPQG